MYLRHALALGYAPSAAAQDFQARDAEGAPLPLNDRSRLRENYQHSFIDFIAVSASAFDLYSPIIL
jgi:hypothetical protein